MGNLGEWKGMMVEDLPIGIWTRLSWILDGHVR
jgi:hypothetical protein